MSKKIYLFSLVLLALSFVSCSETEKASLYDNWQARNVAFIDSIANVYETVPGRGGLSRFEMIQAPGTFMYYKDKSSEAVKTDELNTDRLDKRPTGTATVKVFYKGTNILGEYFDGNFIGKNPVADDPDNAGDLDANVGDSSPTSLSLPSLVVGWQEALIQMRVGERWEIYIPSNYGYGGNDQTTVLPANSTLIFDIQLLDASSVIE